MLHKTRYFYFFVCPFLRTMDDEQIHAYIIMVHNATLCTYVHIKIYVCACAHTDIVSVVVVVVRVGRETKNEKKKKKTTFTWSRNGGGGGVRSVGMPSTLTH